MAGIPVRLLRQEVIKHSDRELPHVCLLVNEQFFLRKVDRCPSKFHLGVGLGRFQEPPFIKGSKPSIKDFWDALDLGCQLIEGLCYIDLFVWSRFSWVCHVRRVLGGQLL